ncbi:MAG: bifunctional 4-hydroxy-2-oxoglutarate aldolase/2-dehydro-3-deoxy-phosphogluconate aldolase [Clostridia bacterium]|nr:bifunctional 4-hydroxy-2-oxoglutarate aldolase/2-dehydro-3-deoxy-phosphogluconate aldolase [Clostridia bacterium]
MMNTELKLNDDLPCIKTREEVIKSIDENKVIAIIRGVNGEALINTAKAIYEGGVRVMEITFDATGKTTEQETGEMISALIKALPDDACIGSGTVVDTSKVVATRNAGGCFIISPDANESVIKLTRELGMVSIPGAITPTEICSAHAWGADFVKLFPVGTFGLDYVKAIKAPLSHIKMLAVGGVSAAETGDYMNAGICGFGVGSAIVKKDLISAGEFVKIRDLARAYVDGVNK